MILKIKKVSENATLPQKAHKNDAGFDLFSSVEEVLAPGEFKKIPVGIAIELPKNTEAQIRPRSGLAANYGVTLLNAPGTIDEGFRGEICVIMINHSKEPFEIKVGSKIAQMVIKPTYDVELQSVLELSDTLRGDKGFGSSGY